MKKLTILLLLFAALGYGQQSRLVIKADGDSIVYDLRRCYRRGKLLKMKNGLQFKVVIWNGYTQWVDERYLILRSIGGKYSTQKTLPNLIENVTITFEQ